MNQFSAYVPLDRRQAIINRHSLPDRTHGTALFADISGFTPFSEALAAELGPQRGAEELTHTLNRVYNGLISAVHNFSGSVIGFAGDAITCWFDRDDGHRAIACALKMITLMNHFGTVSTPKGERVELAIKTGVAQGNVRRFLIGDPSIQLLDTLAGETLNRMATAEQLAGHNECIVAPEVVELQKKRLVVEAFRQDDCGRDFAVVSELTEPPAVSPASPPTNFNESELRAWVLPPVYTRLLTGQGNYLAELRPAATLFLHFDGLAYDDDPDAGRKLDKFIRWVQNVLNQHEGYLLQIVMGDKGSYLYASFGAPIAHGDDPLRAVAAALKLKDVPTFLKYIQNIKIGISYGRVRTGAYGGDSRKTYGVIGDTVNVSARLMQKASPGQILISLPVFEQVKQRVAFNELGELFLKGKSKAIPVWQVTGLVRPAASKQPTRPLIGRKTEFALADQLLKQTDGKRGQLLQIEGASGIGKSHLGQAIVYQAEAAYQFKTIKVTCHAGGRATPYGPWQTIIRDLLRIDPAVDLNDPNSADAQIKVINRKIGRLNKNWRLRLPLLGELLGLPIPDNPTTAALSAEQRREALHALLIDILGNRSLDRPLLIVIDDAHWIDEGSASFVSDIARTIANRAITLVILQRPPFGDTVRITGLDELNNYQKVLLTELTGDHIQTIAERWLNGRLASLPADLLKNQAQGNPFYAEEMIKSMVERQQLISDSEHGYWRLADRLIDALKSARCLEKKGGKWHLRSEISYNPVDLDLPDSVHGLVLSRLDHLRENEQLTVKVASVIGQLFEFDLLQQIHPGKPEVPDLMTQVTGVENKEFVQLDAIDPSLNYMFRHGTVQEVAYDTLLYAQRRDLHRTIASWYEKMFPEEEARSSFYPLLAYHWRFAEDPAKELGYVMKAARQAAANYANHEALRFFNRSLILVPAGAKAIRFAILHERQKIFGYLGERDAQMADLDQLEELLHPSASIEQQLQFLLAKSEFLQAIGSLKDGLEVAQAAYNISHINEIVTGQIKALTQVGIIHWQMGNFERATAGLQLGLTLGERHDEPLNRAVLLRNLGIVAGIENNFAEAEQYFKDALAVDRANDNKIGEDATLSNLAGVYFRTGDLERCRKIAATSLMLNREIGLRSAETSALINLGSVLHALGDLSKAGKLLTEAIELAHQINDPILESMGRYNLALILIDQNLAEQGQRAAEKAAHLDRANDDQLSLSYSLYAQGLALAAQEQFEDAIPLFSEAAAIRHAVGLHENRIDCLAAQTMALLHLDDVDSALNLVSAIIGWLEANGEEGLENPARVYTTIVAVLLRSDRSLDAEAWLLRGQAYLEQRAQLISDARARHGFLFSTPANRELLNFDLDSFSQNHPAE